MNYKILKSGKLWKFSTNTYWHIVCMYLTSYDPTDVKVVYTAFAIVGANPIKAAPTT